jgi:hypothetical protein
MGSSESESSELDVNHKVPLGLEVSKDYERSVNWHKTIGASGAVKYSQAIKIHARIGASVAVSKKGVINIHYSIEAEEIKLRNANSVFSDIRVLTSELTVEEFRKDLRDSSAVGFTEFEEYQPGYYSFDQALIKYTMRSNIAARGAIDSLKLIVDTPDVRDRGVTNLPIGGITTIIFGREFSAPPVVNALQVGGTYGTVKISNTTRTGFDALIEDNGGTQVEGTINWTAEGR